MRTRVGTAAVGYWLLATALAIGSAQAQTIKPSDTGNGYILYGADGTYQGRLTERDSGGLNILGSDGTWYGKIVGNSRGGFDVRTPDGTTTETFEPSRAPGVVYGDPEIPYDPAEGSYAPGVDYGDGE